MVSVKKSSPKNSSKGVAQAFLKDKDRLLIPSLICLLMAIFAFKIYGNIKSVKSEITLPTTPYPINTNPAVSPKGNSISPTPASEGTKKSSAGQDGCIVGGCNGEVCSDKQVASPCVYKPEFECYKNATCERQGNGSCGWTSTPELISCLGASI